MSNKDLLMAYSHKLYRADRFIDDLYSVIGSELDSLDSGIAQVVANSVIDTADLATVEMYEDQMDINPRPDRSLEERRAAVKTKWRSSGTITLEMLQAVCNAWKNGEVSAAFENGQIKLTFLGEYGVPTDLSDLLSALEDVKPAHLGLAYVFKYLLIKDIMEMSLAEVETQKLSNFAGGAE